MSRGNHGPDLLPSAASPRAANYLQGYGGFPRQETYGLAAQLRRSSASILANIAEGCRRSGDAELRCFMLISIDSASELEYHLLLARDLGYLYSQRYRDLIQRTQ